MVGFLIKNLITKRRWGGEVKKSHVFMCVAAATTALHTICFPSVSVRCNWTQFSISGHQLCCMIRFHAEPCKSPPWGRGHVAQLCLQRASFFLAIPGCYVSPQEAAAESHGPAVRLGAGGREISKCCAPAVEPDHWSRVFISYSSNWAIACTVASLV